MSAERILDAWVQHPSPELIRHEMFASLRRWMRLETVPDSIPLPDGTRVTAFTRGPDWFAVVTGDNRILILDAATGALRQSITIE